MYAYSNVIMNPKHRSILKLKAHDVAEKISIKKLKPFLIQYKIFNKYMLEDIKSADDLFEILPTRGPDAFKNIIEVLREARYYEEAKVLETATYREQPEYPSYTLNSEPLGICLVINNTKFDGDKFTERNINDTKNIKDLFEKIGFEVKTESNLNADGMRECIKNFSQLDILKSVDSVILFILSHGGITRKHNKDFVRGTNGKHVYRQEIIDMFSNKNCKLKIGKPKIIFFIACRLVENCKIDGDCSVFDEVSGTVEADDSRDESLTCKFTDIFFIHSSPPGTISSVPCLDSSFCEDFLPVLKNFYNKYNLGDILKEVNKKLRQRINVDDRTVLDVQDYGGMKGIMLCKQSEIVK